MELKYCRGLPVFCPSHIPLERFEAAMDYEPKNGDIVVSTYPKTGTTWMQYIVWQILHSAESYPSFDDALYRVMPYMEFVGTDVIDALPPPRLYKTHFPYSFMKVNPRAKYIYVHRNPGDTFVSYYHFWNAIREPIEKDKFFDLFMSGDVSCGDFFDHVLSFYAHKNDDNVLLVSYEDLKSDVTKQVLRISQFLGDEYHRKLTEDESLLQKTIEVTSFDYMKKHLQPPKPPRFDESKAEITSTENQKDKKSVNFFRKGIVGDCNSFLSTEQRKGLLEKISSKMKDTELFEPWKSVITL